MQGHMNEPHIEMITLSFDIPFSRLDEAKILMQSLGCVPTESPLPWLEVLKYDDAELPGANLAGARYRAGITQVQLAKKTGLSRHKISQMENGKYIITEPVASVLAKVLNISPELLLPEG